MTNHQEFHVVSNSMDLELLCPGTTREARFRGTSPMDAARKAGRALFDCVHPSAIPDPPIIHFVMAEWVEDEPDEGLEGPQNVFVQRNEVTGMMDLPRGRRRRKRPPLATRHYFKVERIPLTPPVVHQFRGVTYTREHEWIVSTDVEQSG